MQNRGEIPISEEFIDGEKPKKQIGRRSFLRKAGKAAVGAGLLGAVALSQDGNTELETDANFEREGEKNWEQWQQQLTDNVEQLYAIISDIDIDEESHRQYESAIRTADMLPTPENIRATLKWYITAADKSHENIYRLLTGFRGIDIYHKLLPALVMLTEQERGDLLSHAHPSIFKAGTILEFINSKLESVHYSEKIRQEYGIEIVAYSKDFFRANIEEIYKELQMLPPFVVRRAGVKTIYIDEIWLGDGMAAYKMPLELNAGKGSAKGPGLGTTHHELVHYLDFLNEQMWKLWENDVDESGWAKINEGAIPYKYSNGFTALLMDKIQGDKKEEVIPGYAREYGQEGGMKEDKATVSESLLSYGSMRTLVRRAQEDEILKRKMEFMTGYHLDKPLFVERGREISPEESAELGEKYRHLTKPEYGALAYRQPNPKASELLEQAVHDETLRKTLEFQSGVKLDVWKGFGTLITDEEYKAAGFPRRDYWSVWSKDDKGKIWMDVDYFNAVLLGSKIVFEEQNGLTKRTIETILSDGKIAKSVEVG